MTRVLIIEDDPGIRENVAETLDLEGYDTLQAENGLVGVQLAREYLPDLIISDIMMPELDGYGVLTALRNNSSTATIPFILLTARADRDSMRHGMELGADDYLIKPFTPVELLAAIIARLEKHAIIVKEYEQKLDDLRGHLLTTLPHELRTPLTGILGYAEMLTMDGETLERDMIVSMAGHILKSGMRLFRLIENYLLYAQLEIVASDPERLKIWQSRNVDYPAQMVSDAANRKIAQTERTDDLMIQVHSEQRVRIADDSLQKIIEELLDNALKFSNPGTPIKIEMGVQQNAFLLDITNQGRGMTPEQIKNIGASMQFDRKLYEQQGSGLGLVIAKRLAELHRGRLMIESVPDSWTTVRVALPIS